MTWRKLPNSMCGFLKPRSALVDGMIYMGGALVGDVIEFPAGERLSTACDDLFIHQRWDTGDFFSLHRRSAEVIFFLEFLCLR